MKYNIANIGTKEWLDFKRDISFGLYYALKRLNKNIEMSINGFDKGALNIIIGADFLVGQNIIQKIVKENIDYAIYETENFSGTNINNRHNFDIYEYVDLIRGAKFVITPYIKNVWQYHKYASEVDVRYAKWGYYDELINVNIKREKKYYLYDAIFYGLLKGDRAETVRKITVKYGDRFKIIDRNDPFTFKEYYFQNTKCGLNLNYGSDAEFTNPFRIYEMIANDIPVISDIQKDDDGYTELCIKGSSDEVVEMIAKCLPTTGGKNEALRDIRLDVNLRKIL